MRTPSTPPSLRRVRLAVPVLVLATVAGCDGDDTSTATTEPGCGATVHDAAFAVEVDEQVALLDDALARCASFDALLAEMRRYPGIVGYEPSTFVSLRCAAVDEAQALAAPACAAFVAPPTTPSPVAPDVVFVGATLDGRTIEIRPDADTAFVGELPEAIQRTVDIAVEAGCVGVIAQRDQWAAQVADPAIGDEASVYANHAQNVANFIGCVVAPLPSVAPPAP